VTEKRDRKRPRENERERERDRERQRKRETERDRGRDREWEIERKCARASEQASQRQGVCVRASACSTGTEQHAPLVLCALTNSENSARYSINYIQGL